ncbi:histidine kinase N-terminal 7TM domain-containing protein [Natronolimnobius baerhuensis]|uniref:histidine kinase n=1 Tax=Natronolimnobius baerhuensis TaxID=253108 RepID=A0A202ED54_9EURY|nr:histidine kinase N-terminal 7TM domain-containing protein [Natronolimnobius baerhuensis]OVE86174.1 hypothetical protein B2G88_05130 [Natronolimnobius baerhuensis]
MESLQWAPYLPFVFASFVICSVLAAIGWRYREQPAAVPFSVMMSGCALYAGTKILEYATTSLEWSVFWWRLQYLGWVLVPPGALLFALEYTRREYLETRTLIAALAVVPAVTLVFALFPWTPEFVIQNPTMVDVGEIAHLDYEVGIWYHVDTVYSYLVLALALLVLFKTFIDTTPGQRNQVALLAVGLTPLVVLPPVYYYLLPSLFEFTVEIEPYLYVFTGVVFAWGLFKYQVLETTPVPFELLLETTPNGVIVVNHDRCVVEFNDVACDFLDVSGPVVGRALTSLSEPAAEVDAVIAGERDPPLQIDTAIYDVSTTPLTDTRGGRYGTHVVVQDITKRVQYDQLLERHNEQLETLNQMLRHDIRNDTMIALGWAEVLDDLLEDTPAADDAEPILERIDESVHHIVNLTEIATELSQPVATAEEWEQSISLEGVLTQEVQKASEAFPEATFELHDPPDVDVAADSALSSAVSNLLRNAVIHNDAETPRVDVSVEATNGQVDVRIADNGPGIPASIRDDLFERGVTGEQSGGTGLGLHLVQTFIRWYGGSVEVSDNEPTGTVFTITLPTTDQQTSLA